MYKSLQTIKKYARKCINLHKLAKKKHTKCSIIMQIAVKTGCFVTKNYKMLKIFHFVY